MKLSRLYSNKPNVFEPIDFRPGLNVVLAEIRLPENRDKDTHNLGKTTLGSLLDFCFLASKDPDFFLFKYPERFNELILFLEIELPDSSYLTLRRSVENASEISFKKHEARHQDFTDLVDKKWDHLDIPFARAKILLDSLLDWQALKPWNYRKGLGYQLRSQNDYSNVFQLGKFSGAHSDWKPYLAHILGFNADLVSSLYEKEEILNEKKQLEATIKSELSGPITDISEIQGILFIKQQEADKKQELLDAFDFRTEDKNHVKELVGDIDEQLALLNAQRYSLSNNKNKIQQSLENDQILFDPDEAEILFKQAGIFFQGQIKKDFQQLIAFNQAITEERRGYLEEELTEIKEQLTILNGEINSLGKKRSRFLSFLQDTDVLSKYKEVSGELVTLRADITSLERQYDVLHRLQELRTEMRKLREECNNLQDDIQADVQSQRSNKNSIFYSIRLFFNEIVEEVIARKALINVSINAQSHLEFTVQILDERGNVTSADLGHTYRKLLCIAFDLALLRAHLDDKFPRFVYHDGVFESLDDRKKENLLVVIKQYTNLGIQSIITLIDSDIPNKGTRKSPMFNPEEIVLVLHDENEQGRLFKTKAW